MSAMRFFNDMHRDGLVAKAMEDPSSTLVDRFFAKIDRGVSSGCWEWTGTLNGQGYGVIGVGPRGAGLVRVHRLSWMLHYPERQLTGLFVCHACDNRKCVRPDDLFLGTNADNAADMRRKGRGVPPPHHRGERNPKAKLSDSEVTKMRDLHACGMTIAAVARLYATNYATTWSILRGDAR